MKTRKIRVIEPSREDVLGMGSECPCLGASELMGWPDLGGILSRYKHNTKTCGVFVDIAQVLEKVLAPKLNLLVFVIENANSASGEGLGNILNEVPVLPGEGEAYVIFEGLWSSVR
jgi:hypothetical protein